MNPQAARTETNHGRLYLDYNATTPVHPSVAAAMQSALDSYGNPSSAHWAGEPARLIIENSRRQLHACSAASPTR